MLKFYGQENGTLTERVKNVLDRKLCLSIEIFVERDVGLFDILNYVRQWNVCDALERACGYQQPWDYIVIQLVCRLQKKLYEKEYADNLHYFNILESMLEVTGFGLV